MRGTRTSVSDADASVDVSPTSHIIIPLPSCSLFLDDVDRLASARETVAVAFASVDWKQGCDTGSVSVHRGILQPSCLTY